MTDEATARALVERWRNDSPEGFTELLQARIAAALAANTERLERIAIAFYDDVGLSDEDREWWYAHYAEMKAAIRKEDSG